MRKLSRILVPVDFSESSGAALDLAVQFAQVFRARILVLHVWEPPRFMGPEVMFFPVEHSRDSLVQSVQSEARNRTSQFVSDQTLPPGVRLSTRIEAGIPYATIVDVAEAEHIDLIIMGTHGRSGLTHFFLGSVAERVVRHAPCPVLTIRERGESPPPSAESAD